jgi:hypothetical protein
VVATIQYVFLNDDGRLRARITPRSPQKFSFLDAEMSLVSAEIYLVPAEMFLHSAKMFR